MSSPLRACLLLALGACAGTPEAPSALRRPAEPFRWTSADGRGELELEGLFQVVLGVFDGDREPSSDAELKRMRPELAGGFEGLRFRLEPKLTEDDVELEEAWVGVDLAGGDARLMLGRMKAPFNLEEVRSRRHIDFPAFSIVNQLAPAEDHGVFVNGRAAGGLLEYGVAAYNGTGESDTNSSKDVAGRLMVHPFAGREDSVWRNLQVGIAGTYGDQEEGVGGGTIDNEANLPVVTFAPDAALDGERVRAGFEGAWFHGPWMAQAEWVAVRQDMAAGGAEDDVTFEGGYLTLSRVLTGEDKSFAGVRPDAPFDFVTGSGRGAWIVAVRYSELDLDDELAGPLTAPGAFTDRIRSGSLGLNWVPNEHAIVRHTLIWSDYDDPIDPVGSDEVAFVVELQLHF